MSRFSKIMFFVILIFSVGFTSCKEEVKKPVKRTKKVVQKKVVPKPEPIPEPVFEKVPNKYFLISASFQNRENAKSHQQDLINSGYDAEVHSTKNGFYRVSYKGFSDKNAAFEELKNARSTAERFDNWLYIKR